MSAPGIDVASYQGSPNWQAVKNSGVQFAYIKASEGSSSNYSTLDSQHGGAMAAGLVCGLYHYARTGLSPESNADAFAAQVLRRGAIAGHLPPCLDLEEGSGYLGDWAAAFVARFRAKTGARRICVYSGSSFFSTQITERWMDPDIMLWIAHYGRDPGKPGYLTSRVGIHQYSSTGSIPGIGGDVDMNFPLWPLANMITGSGAAPAPAPTTKTFKQEDLMADIEIDMFNDGTFRGAANCEAGDGSAVFDHGWVTFGVLWGGTADFKISFLSGGGVMKGGSLTRTLSNNQDFGFQVPSGCRMVTVEGKASSPSVKVVAARVLVPR